MSTEDEDRFLVLMGLGEDALEHYGVKGMKWGVIREDDRVGTWGSLKDAKVTPITAEQKAKNEEGKKATPVIKRNASDAAKELQANHIKSLDKLDPSGTDAEAKKGLTRDQKVTIAKIGVGVAVVGGLYLLGKQAEKAAALAALEGHDPNSPMGQFLLNTHNSKMKTWGLGGYIQPTSWDRPEFELPAGHTFNRLSMGAESEFRLGTYATHSAEDFRRYVAGFSGELGGPDSLQHITWTSQTATRVPNLSTVIDTTQEIMQKSAVGRTVTKAEAIQAYQNASGGSWSNSFAKQLFQSLQEKGYGAIVDEMDAGVIGETPLVVFARDQMNAKQSNPLTKDAIEAARNAIQDIPRPPRKPS